MHTFLVTLLVVAVGLLVAFLLCAVLLLRRSTSRRRWQRSPQSISTPYGYIGLWDVTTQRHWAEGLKRAKATKCYKPKVMR